MMMLKKGAQVKIISGKDKGKTGEILEINRKLNKVKIKSINMVKRHTKPTKKCKLLVLVHSVQLIWLSVNRTKYWLLSNRSIYKTCQKRKEEKH